MWIPIVITVLVAACGGAAHPTDGGPAAPLPTVDLSGEPVADAPDPADRAGASADFIECDFGIAQGGWSRDFGAPGSARDPKGAVAVFVESRLFWLPAEGYVATGQAEDRMLFTYSAGGKPRAAVIVADSTKIPLDAGNGWAVETFAACDPAEFDPSADRQLNIDVWLDQDGNRVPTSILTSYRGAEHCDWQSVTFLIHGDRQYVRDPQGALNGVELVANFDDDATLPALATDTGYQGEHGHLWLSADGSIAYLVDGDHIELWPAPIDMIGCE